MLLECIKSEFSVFALTESEVSYMHYVALKKIKEAQTRIKWMQRTNAKEKDVYEYLVLILNQVKFEFKKVCRRISAERYTRFASVFCDVVFGRTKPSRKKWVVF